MYLQLPQRRLELSAPVVMGVLNVTPDSFSDGGRYRDFDAALTQARRLVEEGAAILDVGGESTRPGAEPVSEAEELDRVIPMVERLRAEFDVVVSIDTLKPGVMRAACAAGAEIINDVNALQAEGALAAAAGTGAAVCLMHMQGEPRTMQVDPQYRDVVREVGDFLAGRAALCRAAGIAADRILLDPGFGFGKTLTHNLALLANLERLDRLGYPLLVGLSRKSMFGQLLGAAVDQRLHGSLAAAVVAAWQGAIIIRAHDVRPTVEALKVVAALRESRERTQDT